MEEEEDYVAVVQRFKLSTQQLSQECSFKVMLKLSTKLTGWRNVAPYLLDEKSTSVVDVINKNHDLDDQGKRLELLKCWKELRKSSATYEALIRALVYAGRRDLSEAVAEALNPGQIFFYSLSESNKCMQL